MKLPLLIKSKSDIADLLKKDLEVEDESIKGYEATIAIAPDSMKDVLTEILNDEKDHAEKIRNILNQ